MAGSLAAAGRRTKMRHVVRQMPRDPPIRSAYHPVTVHGGNQNHFGKQRIFHPALCPQQAKPATMPQLVNFQAAWAFCSSRTETKLAESCRIRLNPRWASIGIPGSIRMSSEKPVTEPIMFRKSWRVPLS